MNALSVRPAPTLRRAWVRQLMGMPISIHLRGAGVESASAELAVEAAFADLAWVEEVFSPFRANSELSRLRRGELSLAECVPELAQVWRLCEQAEAQTGGAFSAFLPSQPDEQVPDAPGGSPAAPVAAIADQATEPALDELADDRVRRFNPTGLVKGWAIERAAAILAGLDDVTYCINAGGDIAVGAPVTVDRPKQGRPQGDGVVDERLASRSVVDESTSTERAAGAPVPLPWRLGIESPYHRGRVAHVVELVQGGMATSGTAARGLHLLDPSSGLPVRRGGSVSVIAPSIMWADVWATALFVSPSARARFPREPGWSQVWI